MSPRELRCKFDAAHGPFVGPLVLGKHYRTAHADEYEEPESSKRVRCRICEGTFTKGSIYGHITKQHRQPQWQRFVGALDEAPLAEPRGGQLVLATATEVDASPAAVVQCPQCRIRVSRHNLARHIANKHPNDHVEPMRPTHVVGADWEVDDIVLPVIEQLANPGGLVPVHKLGALFSWRDATARMLRDVAER